MIDSEAGTSQVTVGEAVTPVQQTPALVQVRHFLFVLLSSSTRDSRSIQDTTLLQGMGKQRLPKD